MKLSDGNRWDGFWNRIPHNPPLIEFLYCSHKYFAYQVHSVLKQWGGLASHKGVLLCRRNSFCYVRDKVICITEILLFYSCGQAGEAQIVHIFIHHQCAKSQRLEKQLTDDGWPLWDWTQREMLLMPSWWWVMMCVGLYDGFVHIFIVFGWYPFVFCGSRRLSPPSLAIFWQKLAAQISCTSICSAQLLAQTTSCVVAVIHKPIQASIQKLMDIIYI